MTPHGAWRDPAALQGTRKENVKSFTMVARITAASVLNVVLSLPLEPDQNDDDTAKLRERSGRGGKHVYLHAV